MLRRSADDTEHRRIERPVVANADQLVIVTALADPPPRPRMIDRCLVAAYDADIEPLLCLTKADLAPPDELRALYAPLGVPYVVRRSKGGDRSTSCASGSPAGSACSSATRASASRPWSTRWCRTPDRAVSHVNPVTGRGRHTSTSAVALELPGGGWIIDTPGVRSFGLAHVSADTVLLAFPDLVEGSVECPKGCNHLDARSAPSTPGSGPRATPIPSAWPRCAVCSPAARAGPIPGSGHSRASRRSRALPPRLAIAFPAP